jgi:LmbE family N-acetylglucosaminyl deacetylase
MKKIIFGIFAHPDDEAMGPGGTLLLETRAGAELHLITFTDGNAGTNPDNFEDLGKTRLNEWREAGNLLGATSMHSLDYSDGTLSNLTMIEASTRIIDIVQSVLVNSPDDAEIEFMTLDLNGLTGHIDHIVAARTACLAFYSLKQNDTRLRRIRLFCLPAATYPKQNTSWIYMEQGRNQEEIDEIIDATSLNSDIVAVIRTHHTQRNDGENIIAQLGDKLGLNHFIVKR